MIKFFRTIRRNLISRAQTGIYLKYALGEIILVVIGILIALQINNWNEERLSGKMAQEVYGNLLTSLEQDSIEVQIIIELLTHSLKTQRNLIDGTTPAHLYENNQEDLDNIVGAISSSVMSFFPKTGVYNLIVSNNGMDLLKSNEIKAALINLYDFQYKRYENVDAIIDHKYHYYLGSLIRKEIGLIGEFDSQSEYKIVKHADPGQFKKYYDDLVAECRDIYGVLSTGNNYLIQIRKSISELLHMIRQEMNS